MVTLAEVESEAIGTGLTLCSVTCSRKYPETVLSAFTTTGPGGKPAATCSAWLSSSSPHFLSRLLQSTTTLSFGRFSRGRVWTT